MLQRSRSKECDRSISTSRYINTALIQGPQGRWADRSSNRIPIEASLNEVPNMAFRRHGLEDEGVLGAGTKRCSFYIRRRTRACDSKRRLDNNTNAPIFKSPSHFPMNWREIKHDRFTKYLLTNLAFRITVEAFLVPGSKRYLWCLEEDLRCWWGGVNEGMLWCWWGRVVVERKGRGRMTLAILILSDTETKGESESGTKK